MGAVDLKILAVVMGTIFLFTAVSNVIPQLESDVPEELAFGADVTAEELVEAGRGVYEGVGGCVACHAETPGARGPNLITSYEGEGPIGERCGDRIPGLSCKEYLHQALVRPQEYVVGDYPPIMPAADRTLTEEQIWALVAYLEDQGGEVTVTADDIGADAPAPTDAPPAAAGPEIVTADAEEIVDQLCLMCHTLGDQGTPLGPTFDGIGSRLTSQEIRLGILDPGAFVSEGYEDLQGAMPPNFGERLTASQLESVVRYLSALD